MANAKPVIFLAFATDYDAREHYLRNLPEEYRTVRQALEAGHAADRWDIVARMNSTIGDILDVFSDARYQGRIAIFHFGGHPGSYKQLQESAQTGAGGLAGFLGGQGGLQLIFLSGCSTQTQVKELVGANVAAVVGTSPAIDDEVCTRFAGSFYGALAAGAGVQAAFEAAANGMKLLRGGHPHDTYRSGLGNGQDGWPWTLYVLGEWSLVPVVTIAGRENEVVTLDVGRVEGVTTQSLWAVYPPGTGDDAGTTPKLGFVEIADVRETDASAHILSETSEGAIVPGTEAIEQEHNYGEMRLRVAIEVPSGDDSGPAGELRAALRKAELLRVVNSTELSDVIVRFVPRGLAVKVGPSGEQRILEEPAWVLEDRQSGQVMPPAPGVLTVRLNLESLAKYRNALSLVNPNLKSPLAGKVDLILRKRVDDAWIVPKAKKNDELPILYEGDEIQLEIRNDASQSIYASIIDFGLSGAISLIFGEEPFGIRPGETVPAHPFHDSGGRLQLVFPRDFIGAAGIECLKLFATSYPTDWSAMFLQDGVRGVVSRGRGLSTELGELIDLALTGHGSRERRPVQLPLGQEWTTVERRFELRRSGA